MPTVILENRTKRPRKMLVLNLTKNVSSERLDMRSRVESKDGVRRVKAFTKTVPGSLRIPHGKSVEVPESYLGCPEVAKAVQKRLVRVTRKEDSKKVESKKSSTTAHQLKPKRRGSKK